MSGRGYELLVDTCETCPFIERTMFSLAADWFASRKAETPKSPTGTCKHAADGRPFPFGRLHIANITAKPPEKCPLREGATLVKLRVP